MGVSDGPKLPHIDRWHQGSAMGRTPVKTGDDRLIRRDLRTLTDVACRLLIGCELPLRRAAEVERGQQDSQVLSAH
jgi:hypothetical protein